MAVMSIGLVGGALSYLLRREGVDPARGASIVAFVTLPHAIYFLWGPITDFWMRRRNLAHAGGRGRSRSAAGRVSSGPSRLILCCRASCSSVCALAASSWLPAAASWAALRSEKSRRLAGSFYQSGSLAFGGLAVFLARLARRPVTAWLAGLDRCRHDRFTCARSPSPSPRQPLISHALRA